MADAFDNQSPSEQYRLAAKAWVAADSAASILEETKTAVLAQWMNACDATSEAAKNREVRGSQEWMDFVLEMVKTREKANLAKVKVKYYEMKYYEWQSENANARSERRM